MNYVQFSPNVDVRAPAIMENRKTYIYVIRTEHIKGAEATCVEIAAETKKCFRLKDMLNVNVL